MATIQEFNIAFNGTTEKLQNAMKGIKAPLQNLHNQFMKIGAAIGAAFAGGAAIKAAADLGNELANFESQTGIAGESVSDLGSIMGEFGGSAQEAMQDLDNLQKIMQESTSGQGALINATKKYGLQVSNQGGRIKNLGQVYGELQKSVSKYDKAKQNQILKEMGLTDSSIRMIMNKKNLEESLNRGSNTSLSQDEIKAGKEFSSILTKIREMFVKIAAVILKSCMPAIKATFGFFEKIWRHLVSTGFRLVKVLGIIVGILVVIKIVMIGISLAAQGVLWPLTLIVAVVIIVVLIVEDIWTFFQGGDSITGRIVAKFKEWLERFPLLKKYLEMVVAFWSTIWDWIKKCFDYIMNFTWDGFINDLKNVGSKIYNCIKDAIVGAVKSGWDAFKSFFGFGGKADNAVKERDSQTTNNTTINQTNNITTNNPGVANQAQNNANKQIAKAVQGKG